MTAATHTPLVSDDMYVLWVVVVIGLALAYTLTVFVLAHRAERRAERIRRSREQLARTVSEARAREAAREAVR